MRRSHKNASGKLVKPADRHAITNWSKWGLVSSVHGEARIKPADDNADIKVYYDNGTKCSYRVNFLGKGDILSLGVADNLQDPDYCPSGDFAKRTSSQAEAKPAPGQQGNESVAAAFKAAPPQVRHAWYDFRVSTPTPQNGCFVTSFPSTEQKEFPCATAAPEEATARRPAIIGKLASDYILLPSQTQQ